MTSVACAFDGCNKPAKHRGYCEACYSRLRKNGTLKPITPEDRLFKFVSEDASGCWPWIGAKAGTGYGMIRWDGRSRPAHRVMYEFFIGAIPEGLDLDHLCRVRHCVNPWHLDPVTRQVNIRRGDKPKVNAGKTHCPHGHPYDEANTIVYKGSRFCRKCRNARQKAHQAAKRGMQNALPLGSGR
ncbi:HNH endonuclease [Streptomyces viridosporus ATCC 14672]|uniref:HNH endonuclease n=1 Tax=Streptomyces viridosporus (strain ATCC 14672 / DSM 40746 / JCM 4963 / KCTC 9882 / NRRL B-12104 / FH 1290) TaxID=566461 RepID=D6A4E0_STRV1|nr:HNH endonuclease [Streptomyces viridosporus ATCC 14672]